MNRDLESFGLTRNPFDPAPLEATKRDMGLFVGRNSEIKEMRTLLASIKGGLYRVVVMGAYGVGKTSFLNRLFWETQQYKKSKLVAVKLIAKEDMTFLNFMLVLMDKLIDVILKVDLKKHQQKTVEEIRLNLDFERQVGTETSGEVTGTLSAVIASLASRLGVKESEVRTPHPWNERSALRDLNTLIDLAFKVYDGIVVGIDEVDYLATPKAREVLRKGREEIFQRRNFLFVFSGTLRFRALLNKIGSPVREIIDKYIILEPFRYPEERSIMKELVDLRLKNVAKDGMSYKNPFRKDSMELIFTLSGGVPRRILRFLQNSMDAGLASSSIVNTMIVLSSVRKLGKGHYAGLPLLEKDIVKLLAKKERIAETDFQAVRRKFNLSEAKERKVRASLEAQGLLNSTFVGQDRLYSLAPELRVFVLHKSKLATPIFQIEAAQKIRQTISEEKDAKSIEAHTKYASLLEGEGHLGLLNIEYNSISKEERLSHCSKTLTCLRNLPDGRLEPVIKGILGVVSDIKEGLNDKAIRKTVAKVAGQLKDYTKSVFEPTKPGADRLTIDFGFPGDKRRRVLLEMGKDVSFRNIVLYEALLQELLHHSESLAAAEKKIAVSPLNLRVVDAAHFKKKTDKKKKGLLRRIKDRL